VRGYAAYRRHEASRPFEWSGTVEVTTIEVGSRVGGRVKDVLVREGDDVPEGATLVVLEPGDLEAQRLQAEGQLEQAEANLERVARGGARAQEIAAARSRLEADEVTLAKATLDLARTQALFERAVYAQADVDNARFALDRARAARDSQRAELEQLLRVTTVDVKAFQGQVHAARGRLDQIRTMLAELTIVAPRAARVQTIRLRPGDLLAPGAIAAKLLEPDQIFVRIYVPETELGIIHAGASVPFFVDTFPGRPFHAVVESVSAQGEFTPRNVQTVDERADQVFAARLRPLDGGGVLHAGMAAIVRVPR
jgi:multidrug resistance efflux pump